MKLNFWQWVGIVLLIAGVIGLVAYENRDQTPPVTPTPVPVPVAPADAQ